MIFNMLLNTLLTFFLVSLCIYYFFIREFKHNELLNHPTCSNRTKKYTFTDIKYKVIFCIAFIKCIEFGYVLFYTLKLM